MDNKEVTDKLKQDRVIPFVLRQKERTIKLKGNIYLDNQLSMQNKVILTMFSLFCGNQT